MLKKVILLSLSLLVLGTFSCKDKEETVANSSAGKLTDADKKKLVDKIWYTTLSSGGVNMEFKSNGIFRINKSLDGTWAWSNNGDTMNIVDYGNTKYKNVFITIGANQMTFRSNQSSDNYKTLFTMKDTE
jgi:hypothetical protein